MSRHSTPTALLTALLLAVPMTLQAQTTLGLRGGVTVSHASLDLADTFARDNRTGFVGGA